MATIGSIIAWIVFGLIVGALARLLVPGRQPMSMLATILLGIAGSVVGGLLGWLLRGGEPDLYQPAGWILSTICAIVLIVVFQRMQTKAP